MFIRLLAAFILIPLIELYLLLQLAEATSLGTTILIVIGTGILGSWLARREGLMAWFRFQEALSQGRVPSRELQDGLMIVFAAALLLTPGLLTDAVGFTLLVPVGRSLIRRYVLGRYIKGVNVQVHTSTQSTTETFSPNERSGDGYTIDAKAVHRHDG
ncbi:MAG: FxsA family protein [Pirellulaceae bacterium]|nr:FxsA family protein [Pirellulaceae bacterium]